MLSVLYCCASCYSFFLPSPGSTTYSSAKNDALIDQNKAALAAKEAEINQANLEAAAALLNKDLGGYCVVHYKSK